MRSESGDGSNKGPENVTDEHLISVSVNLIRKGDLSDQSGKKTGRIMPMPCGYCNACWHLPFPLCTRRVWR